MLVGTSMVPDVCALARRDHDDLDHALAAMVDTNTLVDELPTLLDVFKLAFAVHVAAETKVMTDLIAAIRTPQALQLIATQLQDEHEAQQRAADALLATEPASDDWYARALELRVLVLDHATRAELLRWTLQDHVPLPLHRTLASDYATERMRVLAKTSPVALARARLASA